MKVAMDQRNPITRCKGPMERRIVGRDKSVLTSGQLFHFPGPQLFVSAARYQLLSIGGEADRPDVHIMAVERLLLFPRGCIPEPDRLIDARAREQTSVARYRHLRDLIAML